MSLTASSDYQLPGKMAINVGNLALTCARLLPRVIADWFIKHHQYYQEYGAGRCQSVKSASRRKWESLDMPSDLDRKSVLDIGCAEGFFCCESTRHNAADVTGVDSHFAALLCAQFLASRDRLSIKYRMGVFPHLGVRKTFDYVLCLSVLHHFVSTKDIWRIITDDNYRSDRIRLGEYLVCLRALTASGGQCVVEIPYEYENAAVRTSVDFERFNTEFLLAGFASVRCLGVWDSETGDGIEKDRAVYVAKALES